MKRIGNLFEQIFSHENMYAAYLDARRGKRKKRACFLFDTQAGTKLEELHTAIHAGTYQPVPYFKFTIYEPKERIIYAPAFEDIVVQHAIYRIINPIFNRTFIDQSYACRIGKGTHKASDYTQSALRKCDPESYTLKLDIRKFFYSIDRAILQRLIERVIKDQRLVAIMMQFAAYEHPVGIPIGNLLSQLYALIYLSPIDHYIKRELKVKLYCRYVDDFILFGLTRKQCLEQRALIIAFIRDKLHLDLSKSTIAKVRRGVNFVGFRTWQSARFIRKHSMFKFRRYVRKGRMEGIVSILGHARKTASLPYLLNLLKEPRHGKNLQLPKSVRRLYQVHGIR
jgi:retron-type reverse transcriptase